MKTSRAARLEEWNRLRMLAMNGRLTIWGEIKRWCKLRKEFEPELKPLKRTDNQ